MKSVVIYNDSTLWDSTGRLYNHHTHTSEWNIRSYLHRRQVREYVSPGWGPDNLVVMVTTSVSTLYEQSLILRTKTDQLTCPWQVFTPIFLLGWSSDVTESEVYEGEILGVNARLLSIPHTLAWKLQGQGTTTLLIPRKDAHGGNILITYHTCPTCTPWSVLLSNMTDL